MVLKYHEELGQYKGTMQIKGKMKSEIDPGGQTIIVIDDEDEKSKVKRKHSGKDKAANQMTANQKKKQKHSKLQKSCADYLQSTFCNNGRSDLKSLKEAERTMRENSSDSASVKETGKAPKIFKKKKKRQRFCHEQGRIHEVPDEDLSEAHHEIHSLSKKCKRRVPASQGDDEGFAPKKKRKHSSSFSMMLQNEDSEDESRKPFSKKTKLTFQDGKMLSGNKRGLIHLNATRDCDIVKQEHEGVCDLASVDSQGSRNGIGCARTDSWPKQEGSGQGRALVDRQHPENGVGKEMIQKEEKRRRRKKEKRKAKEVAAAFVDHQGDDSENLLGTKNERKKVGVEDQMSLMGDTEGVRQVTKKKKKKKKKKQAKTENDCPSPAEDSGGMSTSGREAATKGMKKKAQKAEKVHAHDDHCTFQEEVSKLRVRKGKGRQRDGSKEKPNWKKAKVKDEAKAEEDDLKIVAIKEGNCDEVSIDKLRRRALQEEIDRESGKTKALQDVGESDAHFGQWGTATFESLERKNKFLRLLGGFKNSSASAQSSPVRATKTNMALAQAGEKRLLQNLQTEFDKARDFKRCRGFGLGFQSPTQKHMVIDKYASKSIKFES
ncbi:hypothetical protein lerEdw1_016486 [Lerista edwardsae]|nr:hypothetical protein lerEdw1_016486 [Lerista edwardsae]